MSKTVITCAAFSLMTGIATASPAITLLNNQHGVYQAPIGVITNIIKQTLDTSNNTTYAAIQVQPIYNKAGHMDHLLAYLPSKKDYSVTVTRINLKQNQNGYSAGQVTPNYRLTQQDWQQQPNAKASKCPDPSVEFVAATPVPDYPTAKQYVDQVYQDASQHGYKSVELLGSDASVSNYQNYLSCPKLKGFFSIGHGSPNGILLFDGDLGADQFSQMNKELKEHAVVLLNSCEVFNDPMKSDVIDGSDPQKYAGGISTLLIGTSEPASACFWSHAFDGKPMSQWLNSCATKIDPNDTWGIGGNGTDTLAKPS